MSTPASPITNTPPSSTPSTSSLKREILLLERLLKNEKSEKQKLEASNASLRNAITDQQTFYEEKVTSLEKRVHTMKLKLGKHTSSAEYKKFIIKEVEYEKLLQKERDIRERIEDRKSELRVLLLEIEEKHVELKVLRDEVQFERENLSEVKESQLLDEVVFRNLDTGECSSLAKANGSGDVAAHRTITESISTRRQNSGIAPANGIRLSVNTSSGLSPSSSIDSGLSTTSEILEKAMVANESARAVSFDSTISSSVGQWQLPDRHSSAAQQNDSTTIILQTTAASHSGSSHPPLQYLPPMLLVDIFTYMDEVELCHVNLVSRYFYELSSCDAVWTRIYLTQEYPSIDFSTTYRPIQYKLRYILAKHGLLHFVAPIQCFELYSCVLGTMGKYRLKISHFIRKSQYLKKEDTPKKVRLTPISNVRRGMSCVAFFHLKHHTNPHVYAGVACSSQKLVALKCALLQHQISRSLLEVRSREAYIEDRFTKISEEVFNKNGTIASKILLVEEKVIEFVQESFEKRAQSVVRIQRSGGFKEHNTTEAYISEFDTEGKQLSEGIIKIEIRPHDLAILSFSIVGIIVDKLCVESSGSLNLSRCQKQVEESLEMQIKYLPHRMDDIRTKVEQVRIKKKSTGESMPCIFLSHELNFYLVNVDGEIQARKHYELMVTPQHQVVFHYRNAFKRKDYQNYCTLTVVE